MLGLFEDFIKFNNFVKIPVKGGCNAKQLRESRGAGPPGRGLGAEPPAGTGAAPQQ